MKNCGFSNLGRMQVLSCLILWCFFFLPSVHEPRKKVVSVLWQEWQVWGIITGTWKVCVSTFGHLRRIDPHRAPAGLMSRVSLASNEERAIATVLHQPSAPSVQHPITPRTHGASSRTAVDVLSYISAAAQCSERDSARMFSYQDQSWNHCEKIPLGSDLSAFLHGQWDRVTRAEFRE